MWTIIGQRTVIVIVDIAGRRCCQGYHRVGIGRPVDVKGLLQSVDDGGRAKWRGAGNTSHFFIFFGVLSPHSSRANYIRDGYRWCAVTRKPGSAWLEGTPAMDLGHMNVVLKWMYLYLGSGVWNWNGYYY